MAVSKRLRYEVLRRDNHACRYCGGVAPDVVLTVDHVTPAALGGPDDPTNLVTACRDCNAGKSAASPDASLVADVAQDAIRWAEAIRMARAAELDRRDDLIDIEKAVWAHLEPYSRCMPSNWFTSIEQFVAAGLDGTEIIDAAIVAAGARVARADVWRYFCGVCWRKVTKRQEAARALLATQEQQERHPSYALIEQLGIDGWFGKALYSTLSRHATDTRMLDEMGV